jgi:hypothetical protein
LPSVSTPSTSINSNRIRAAASGTDKGKIFSSEHSSHGTCSGWPKLRALHHRTVPV